MAGNFPFGLWLTAPIGARGNGGETRGLDLQSPVHLPQTHLDRFSKDKYFCSYSQKSEDLEVNDDPTRRPAHKLSFDCDHSGTFRDGKALREPGKGVYLL